MEEMNMNVAEEKVAEENDTPQLQVSPKDGILNFAKKLFSPANRIKTISAIAAVVLLTVMFGGLHYLSPRAVALRYVNAMFWDDEVALKRCVAYDYYAYKLDGMSEEEYFAWRSDILDEDIKSWRDLSRYSVTATKEELEDEYGEYRVSSEVTRVKDISNNKMKENREHRLERLEEEVLFDADTIKDSKVVTVKRKISGEDYISRVTIEVYLVKVNGLWKALDYAYKD